MGVGSDEKEQKKKKEDVSNFLYLFISVRRLKLVYKLRKKKKKSLAMFFFRRRRGVSKCHHES